MDGGRSSLGDLEGANDANSQKAQSWIMRSGLLKGISLSLPLVVMLLLLAGDFFLNLQREKKLDRPNVIMIYMDALRADHMSVYGYGRDTTPFISEWAKKAVLFERAMVQAPATYISVPSTLVSKYPSCFFDEAKFMRENPYLTLAQHLKALGYKTIAIISSPMVNAKEYGGFYTQGFDRFDDSLSDDSIWKEAVAGAVVDKALDFLSAERKQPFFLFLYIMDPHDPYRSPPEFNNLYDPDYKSNEMVEKGCITPFKFYRLIQKLKHGGKESMRQLEVIVDAFLPDRSEKSLKFKNRVLYGEDIELKPEDLFHLIALYDGKIKYADAQLGRLFDHLEKHGEMDDTLIVLTSDHGEELGDHNGGLGHGNSLFNEVLHVPLIISCPDILPQGISIESRVRSIDILPSLLRWVGGPAPDNIDGEDFVDLVAVGSERSPRPVLTEGSWLNAKSIIIEDWKYIHVFNRKEQPVKVWWEIMKPHVLELYDLKHDPEERQNLYSQFPEKAEALHSIMMSLLPLQERERLQKEAGLQMSNETQRKLRSLGY